MVPQYENMYQHRESCLALPARGPPDLTPLLGSYAGEYQEALGRTARKYGERHLQVKAAHVVVQKWGHMRNLQGRAYAPDLVPAGVTVDEIR